MDQKHKRINNKAKLTSKYIPGVFSQQSKVQFVCSRDLNTSQGSASEGF